MSQRLALAGSLAALALGVPATTARADGLPVLGIDTGQAGVANPGGKLRYVAIQTSSGTLVQSIVAQGGRVERYRWLSGGYTIPAVAYDATAGGLSGDGSKLVLINPRTSFPRTRTKLLMLDAHNLHTTREIDLPGDFSYDAVSPAGDTVYLVHYLSKRDPTKYEVRAFDARAGKLIAAPIVDPHDSGEKMRGNPLSRAQSPDGRWAYTLYDGNGKQPFIHALDTEKRTARCIDLDALAGNKRLWESRLRLAGGTLRVMQRGEALLAVDTSSYRVSTPASATAPARASSSGRPLLWAGMGAIVLLLLGSWAGARRRRRPATTS